ncbi:MAG: hypothetical protein M3Y57_13380 [Acidobacteriota bacterium]|nr:hypothetical protein [Acidobacteriota bacterium]
MRLYTREDAAALIDTSEGQVIDSSKPNAKGHAHVHVGPPETPIIDQLWRRKLTTMYRNRTQAEKDLRDLLNRHIPELNALQNGAEIVFRDMVSTPRQVHVAAPAGEKYSYAGTMVTNTSRQELFVKIVKMHTGQLHLRTMFLTE